MKIILTMILLSFATVGLSAQNTPSPNICEDDPRFNQFDFWLGDWRVTDRAKGDFQGTNKITKAEKGCLIFEHWTSKAGNTGSSINYYNPNLDEWRQIWVSNGYSIDIKGKLENGSMTLIGKIHYYKTGKSFPFKGTWTYESDGTVRQHFEQYDVNSDAWKVWFDGRYTRSDGANGTTAVPKDQ